MNATSAHDTTALVVIGGLPPKRSVVQHLPRYDFVIAADSGLHAAIDLGLRVAAVVGDMDSVDPAVLAVAEVTGSEIERVPRDKDNTDTELALLTAVARGARRITLITGGGGRLDHQLGVLAVMHLPNAACRLFGIRPNCTSSVAQDRSQLLAPSAASLASRPLAETQRASTQVACAGHCTTNHYWLIPLGESVMK